MLVLGIGDNHDASAALAADGRVLAAASEERFDRTKNSGRFPWAAIASCLATAGVTPAEVDRVAIASAATPPLPIRLFPGVRHVEEPGLGQFTPLLEAYIVEQVAARRTGILRVEGGLSLCVLARRLRARGFTRARFSWVDHHLAHAESAWRTQPDAECLVLTLDAMGDGLTATVSVGTPAGLRRIHEDSGLAAIGTFYSRITQRLGFTPLRHEGKVTGLAARAAPPPELLARFAGMVGAEDGRFTHLPPRVSAADDAFWGDLGGRWTREEVAAAAQRVLEEAAVGWAVHWVGKTGLRRLALAGGAWANVLLNLRVAERPEIERVWVCPAMGDGGLALGAALHAADAPLSPLSTVCWGPAPSEAEAAAALGPLGGRRDDDVDGAVLRALLAGRIVARCDGRMEFGPRALGNRSILARPDIPGATRALNERLRRSDFMPFAPMVLAEDAPRLFPGYAKVADAARFMTTCLPCGPELRARAPDVVHVDGTARPQVVHADADPRLHRILSAFKAATGVPALLNTSFNLHEEPIVATAAEAARSWEAARLDVLAVGSWVAERPTG